jgi:hypothetical protein
MSLDRAMDSIDIPLSGDSIVLAPGRLRDLASKLSALQVRYYLSSQFLECLVRHHHRPADHDALVLTFEMLCISCFYAVFSALVSTHVEG